jgi:hypothetical protein
MRFLNKPWLQTDGFFDLRAVSNVANTLPLSSVEVIGARDTAYVCLTKHLLCVVVSDLRKHKQNLFSLVRYQEFMKFNRGFACCPRPVLI